MLLAPWLLITPSGLTTLREDQAPRATRSSVAVSSVSFGSVWLRLEFLPPAGVPVNPHSSSCSSQKLALVPVFPLPHFALPYALGVLISHFLPRPGAWPGTCGFRSCTLPGTLCSMATDPSYQQQGPDLTLLLPRSLPTAPTSDWLVVFLPLATDLFFPPFSFSSVGNPRILKNGLLWEG